MRDVGRGTVGTKIKRKAILIKLREHNKHESEKIFEQLDWRAFSCLRQVWIVSANDRRGWKTGEHLFNLMCWEVEFLVIWELNCIRNVLLRTPGSMVCSLIAYVHPTLKAATEGVPGTCYSMEK